MYKLHVSVVLRQNDRVLLLQESDEDYGLWNLPGGHIEPEESIQQAAVREALEETGLTVTLNDLLGVYPGFGDKPRTAVRFVFSGTFAEDAQAARPGDDILSLRWFTDAEFAALPDTLLVAARTLRHILATKAAYPLSVVVEE